MDRNYQDSLDQEMIQNKTHDSVDGDGTDCTSDSHKRNRIHLFSHGTHHWQNIASFLAMYDIVAVNLSYFLALWFRFDCHFSSIPEMYLRAWQRFCPFYTVVCLVVFWRLRMYRSIWRFASIGELNRIIVSSMITGAFSHCCDHAPDPEDARYLLCGRCHVAVSPDHGYPFLLSSISSP